MENIYTVLIEQSPVLIWRSGKDGLCDYFNQTWLDFTGKDLKEEIGEGWSKGVHKDDYEYCLSTYLESFKARNVFEMEYRLRRHDGEFRWLLDRGRPFYEDGVFMGYIGSCIDVTATRMLHEEKEKIYKATVSGTNHIMRNLLNQLQTINLKCEEYPDLYEKVSKDLERIIGQSTDLIKKLSEVKDMDEESILKSVMH